MSGIAITSPAGLDESLASARSGVLPAFIGALGAAIALHMLAPLFATASVPMSVLGLVLGLHNRNIEAIVAGGLAVACAVAALLSSDLFWVAFAGLASALTAA